jgi:two-component system, chemotaxis family, protein-glutamate methylesterase/glutaminase
MNADTVPSDEAYPQGYGINRRNRGLGYQDMEKKTIMIVDDSSTMRLVIRNFINSDPNFTVVQTAANGKEALEKLASVKPDLILLDIEMPEMDGLEFLRHARLKTRAKLVVLSSIAQADSPKTIQARSLGADGVVSKPSGAISYDLDQKRGSELWQVIYKLLGMVYNPPQKA